MISFIWSFSDLSICYKVGKCTCESTIVIASNLVRNIIASVIIVIVILIRSSHKSTKESLVVAVRVVEFVPVTGLWHVRALAASVMWSARRIVIHANNIAPSTISQSIVDLVLHKSVTIRFPQANCSQLGAYMSHIGSVPQSSPLVNIDHALW